MLGLTLLKTGDGKEENISANHITKLKPEWF
jgi:hypothetical protein